MAKQKITLLMSSGMTQTYIIYNSETFKIVSAPSFFTTQIIRYCELHPICKWVNANHKGDREIVEKINKVNQTNY